MSGLAPAARHRGTRASVRALVGAVCVGLRVVLAVECALLFGAGALLAHVAALVSGAPDGAGWVLALCGALCAATWWLEHAVEGDATSRVLDRRLRQRGALATAYELEARSGSGAHGAGPVAALNPMEQLLCARVQARLRFGEAFRAALPPLSLPIAAPLVSALLLLLVLDARRATVPLASAPEDTEVAAELVRTLAGSSTESERLRKELRAAEVEARALAAGVERAPEPSGAAPVSRELAAGARALELRLTALLARPEAGGALRARLEEARGWLDALRAGLEAEPEVGRGPTSLGGGGTGAGALTRAAADGTISRPDEPMTNAPSASPHAAERVPLALGLQSGPAWGAEYDAVVVRWIELSRDAALAPDAQPSVETVPGRTGAR